jgi:hypothetical protein
VSKLLIDEPPLQVLPSLAAAEGVGLNGALVLQQVHYWAGRNRSEWVRRSVAEWRRRDFPFWSEGTIRRALAGVEARGLLLVRPSQRADRSKLYAVDYSALATFCQSDRMHLPDPASERPNATGQDGQMRIGGETAESGERARSARGPARVSKGNLTVIHGDRPGRPDYDQVIEG